MNNVCFVDIETTGLIPGQHEPWEIAFIFPKETGRGWSEWRWFLPVNVHTADPVALSIGRYHERHPKGNDFKVGATPIGPRVANDQGLTEWSKCAELIAKKTHNLHLVGNVISFDADFIGRMLRANGFSPSWHYHLIDCEALAVGYLKQRDGLHAVVQEPPWDSKVITEELGIEVSEEDKHTALGDARWAKSMYEVVMG